MVPEIPLKIGNCKTHLAASLGAKDGRYCAGWNNLMHNRSFCADVQNMQNAAPTGKPVTLETPVSLLAGWSTI